VHVFIYKNIKLTAERLAIGSSVYVENVPEPYSNNVLFRDQGKMMSSTLWSVFSFTPNFGGEERVGIFVVSILQL
jgi:hypothetical protein